MVQPLLPQIFVFVRLSYTNFSFSQTCSSSSSCLSLISSVSCFIRVRSFFSNSSFAINCKTNKKILICYSGLARTCSPSMLSAETVMPLVVAALPPFLNITTTLNSMFALESSIGWCSPAHWLPSPPRPPPAVVPRFSYPCNAVMFAF